MILTLIQGFLWPLAVFGVALIASRTAETLFRAKAVGSRIAALEERGRILEVEGGEILKRFVGIEHELKTLSDKVRSESNFKALVPQQGKKW